jgi:ankyrin repeat protein
VDKSGRTALHWAAIGGHSEIAKLLIAKNANLLACTNLKTNALHLAVEANRVETVRVLMQATAEDAEKKTALTMAKNSDEKTAWDISFGAKNKAICQVLKDMGDANGASSSCTIC